MRTNKSRLAAAMGGFVLAIGLAVQPVASAATLLADDFEDGSADGWTRSGGSWSVVTDGSRAYRQSGTSSDARALVGGAWTDQAVQVRVKPGAYNGSGRHVAVLARARSTGEYYYLALTNTGSVVLGRRSGGGFTTLASAAAAAPTGSWHTLRLEAFGTTLRGFLGDTQPECGGSVEEPRNYYAYTLDDPNTVKASVMAGAGTGKI